MLMVFVATVMSKIAKNEGGPTNFILLQCAAVGTCCTTAASGSPRLVSQVLGLLVGGGFDHSESESESESDSSSSGSDSSNLPLETGQAVLSKSAR